jgi:hypothetical protein
LARVRLRPVLAATVSLLAMAGCGPELPVPASESASASASVATPVAKAPPAALAGGACQLIEFEMLEKVLGDHYTVAASAKKDKTNTCVVRTEPAVVPEVALSVTPTKADVAVFKDVVKPKGAKTVEGLGRIGYQVVLPPRPGAGPTLEVGWLAGDARLLFLHLTLPSGGASASAAPKLVALAKELDKSSL